VRLQGPPTPLISGQHPPPVGASQAWLLRRDGTTVAQFANTKESPLGGWNTFGMRFAFQPVPANELAGVVVNVKGMLYVREINPNPAP
jgi:hypothetical protein